jgi:hypothetical protein
MKQDLAPERAAPAPEVDTIALLLRCTELNTKSLAALFPEESEDFIQGYISGHIDALRLALEHVKDLMRSGTAGTSPPLPLDKG